MNKEQGKRQFEEYWRQAITIGHKEAVIAEQSQKASQRASVSTKTATDDGDKARRKTARQGL